MILSELLRLITKQALVLPIRTCPKYDMILSEHFFSLPYSDTLAIIYMI